MSSVRAAIASAGVAILASVVLAGTGAAASSDTGQLILQASYWENFNWAQAKTSDLWANPDFGVVDLNAPPDPKGKKNLRRREVVFDGTSYVATLGDFPRSESSEFATLEFKIHAADECERLHKILAKRFSGEVGPMDNSWSPAPGTFGVALSHWQWDAKNTRVTLECAVTAKGGPQLATARFEAATTATRIQPPITLLCEREVFSTTPEARGWIKASPLTFTAIPLFGVVTDAERVKTGQIDGISRTEMNLAMKTADGAQSLSVSRLNGVMVGTISGIGGKQQLLQGECDKHDLDDRKF
jgi:hypothetical protein